MCSYKLITNKKFSFWILGVGTKIALTCTRQLPLAQLRVRARVALERSANLLSARLLRTNSNENSHLEGATVCFTSASLACESDATRRLRAKFMQLQDAEDNGEVDSLEIIFLWPVGEAGCGGRA